MSTPKPGTYGPLPGTANYPLTESGGIVLKKTKYGDILIDAEDLHLVEGYTWQAHKVGNGVYARACARKSDQSRVYLHRILTNMPKFFVDHKNGNGLDNRRSNLLVTTISGNSHGFRAKPSTGVSYNKRYDHFRASICVNGKEYYLGAFKTEMQASKIYKRVTRIVYDLEADRALKLLERGK